MYDIHIYIYGMYIYGKTGVYQKKYNTLALSRYGPHIGAHGCTSPVHQAKNKKKWTMLPREPTPGSRRLIFTDLYVHLCGAIQLAKGLEYGRVTSRTGVAPARGVEGVSETPSVSSTNDSSRYPSGIYRISFGMGVV